MLFAPTLISFQFSSLSCLIVFSRCPRTQGQTWAGVDILREDVANNMDAFVWEPSVMKINALTAASEAACMILSVDETIRNPKSQQV